MEPVVPLDGGSVERRGRRLTAPTSRVAIALGAVAVLGAIALVAADAVRPFILGVLLVYLLAPAVERIARLGVPRGIAVLLVFAIVVAVVAATLWVALTPLITQARELIADLPNLVNQVRLGVTQFYAGLHLSPVVRDAIDADVQGFANGVGGSDLGALASSVVASIVGVVTTIMAYAILPAWLFYILKDRVRLADALEASLPAGWRGDVFATFAIVDRVFGKWVRGQLALGITVGILSYVGLMALSILVDPVFGRYAILLALAGGLLELLPFIGPIIAAIPALLIALTAGPGGFAAALVLYVAIQLLENNVLVPGIQGSAVNLHPSAVLVALVIGAALGGLLGAIVSLPIAAASRDVFRYAFHRVGEPRASIDESLARIAPALVVAVRRSAVEATERAAVGPSNVVTVASRVAANPPDARPVTPLP